DMWRVVRHAMQALHGDHALAGRPAYVHLGLERHESDGEVTGIDGDAVRAAAQDRVEPVLSLLRGAAAAGLATVARCRDVAEVEAARALQEVASDAGHVADLRGGAQQQRL